MPKFKPTPEQVTIIKQCAAIESAPSLPASTLLLEPGIRQNIEGKFKGETSMNIAAITEQPNDGWNDTDLFDYGYWSDFRKGVELTEDGRGIIDLYIYRRGDKELCGNVIVNVVGGKMTYIEGTGADPIWRIEGGFTK